MRNVLGSVFYYLLETKAVSSTMCQKYCHSLCHTFVSPDRWNDHYLSHTSKKHEDIISSSVPFPLFHPTSPSTAPFNNFKIIPFLCLLLQNVSSMSTALEHSLYFKKQFSFEIHHWSNLLIYSNIFIWDSKFLIIYTIMETLKKFHHAKLGDYH